jgi:hypothetical protein
MGYDRASWRACDRRKGQVLDCTSARLSSARPAPTPSPPAESGGSISDGIESLMRVVSAAMAADAEAPRRDEPVAS